MEDVIETYQLPLDENHPVVCFDESPFQLLHEVREPIDAAPGQPRREDYEYERCGVAEVMMICQPAAGLRKCMVMAHRKKADFAAVCKELDRMFPKAKKITLVCDNLNTHTMGALYATFPAQEARRLATKIEIRHTPKHGSWLNIAELEFAVLGKTVFKKRIADKIDALTKAGCHRLFDDKISGSRAERPGLAKALDMLREGDTLVVWKLDRLGRSVKNLVDLVGQLHEKGMHFKSLTDVIDTGTPSGRFFFHVMASLAEMERELTTERTRAGLEVARQLGRKGGRKRKMTDSKIGSAKKLLASGVPPRDVAKNLGVSVPTLYRWIPASSQA